MKSLTLNNEDSIYDLWLSRVEGIGNQTFQNLIKKFGSSKEVFFVNKKDLVNINEGFRSNILLTRTQEVLDSLQTELNDLKISYLSFSDELYPERLLQITDFPPIIYLKGRIDLIEDLNAKKWIAVVGTRKHDSYGKTTCESLTRELVNHDYVIVSGMAFGIDKLAHVTAIDNGGLTIGVLGSGVDVVSPESNRQVYNKIEEHGLLISELPPGTKPAKFTFPLRNRIIAGLSEGVLVIQAGENSGSLITARLALEQNREVFAVPDNIYKQTGKGSNNLIKCSGAKLVQSVEDILEELNPDYLKEEKAREFRNRIKDKTALIVYEKLVESDGLYIDEIIIKSSGLDASDITRVLSDLELNSLINRAEDGRYYPSL